MLYLITFIEQIRFTFSAVKQSSAFVFPLMLFKFFPHDSRKHSIEFQYQKHTKFHTLKILFYSFASFHPQLNAHTRNARMIDKLQKELSLHFVLFNLRRSTVSKHESIDCVYIHYFCCVRWMFYKLSSSSFFLFIERISNGTEKWEERYALCLYVSKYYFC